MVRGAVAAAAIGLLTTTIVRYGRVATIDGLVPIRMTEEFDVPGVERGRGVATYSNHRLFRTTARVIPDF